GQPAGPAAGAPQAGTGAEAAALTTPRVPRPPAGRHRVFPMSTTRLAGIPIDHVVAEVAAFPLTAEKALHLALTEFDARLRAGEDTWRLWRAAEEQMLGSSPAFSVEEAVTIRDKVWFGNHLTDRVPLADFLRRLAGLFLAVRGDHAVPALPGEEDGPPG